MNNEDIKILSEFINKLCKNTKQLDPEFAEVLYENFDELWT